MRNTVPGFNKSTASPEFAEGDSTRDGGNTWDVVELTAFELLKSRIEAALGSSAISIEYCGFTRVPGLIPRSVIDIDLTVGDIRNEETYIPQLQDAGFQFVRRERHWHQHRLFSTADPNSNLHVWGPNCPEVQRHRIQRSRLTTIDGDTTLYTKANDKSNENTTQGEGQIIAYNKRKAKVIQDVLDRALDDLGQSGNM